DDPLERIGDVDVAVLVERQRVRPCGGVGRYYGDLGEQRRGARPWIHVQDLLRAEVDHEQRVRRRVEVEAQERGGPGNAGQAEGAEELPLLVEDVDMALSVVRAAEVEVRHVDVARPPIDGDALGVPFPGGQAGEGRRLAPIPGRGG